MNNSNINQGFIIHEMSMRFPQWSIARYMFLPTTPPPSACTPGILAVALLLLFITGAIQDLKTKLKNSIDSKSLSRSKGLATLVVDLTLKLEIGCPPPL